MEANGQARAASRRALLIYGAGLGILGAGALLAQLFRTDRTALADFGDTHVQNGFSPTHGGLHSHSGFTHRHATMTHALDLTTLRAVDQV